MVSDRFLYLPSGGIAYDPIIRYSPSNIGMLINDAVPALFNSIFEHFVQTVERSVTHNKIHIHDMLLADFFYLYAQIYVLDLNKHEDDFVRVDKCNHCGYINKILVHFSKVDIAQNNPYKQSIASMTKTIEIKDTNIALTFRRRIVRDNIEFGYLFINEGDDNDVIKMITLYISQQIEKAMFNGSIVPKKEYSDLLNSLTGSHLNSIYQTLLNFDNELGLNNEIIYPCKECNHENTTHLFDNLLLSLIRPQDGLDYQSVVDRLHNVFSMARLPIFGSIEDAMSLPLALEEHMAEAVKKIDFRPIM